MHSHKSSPLTRTKQAASTLSHLLNSGNACEILPSPSAIRFKSSPYYSHSSLSPILSA